MVYFGKNKRTGQGKGPFGIEKIKIGAGPIAITSAKPSLQRQVMNVKKSVAKIENKEELKYVDTFMNSTAITTTATLTLLNGLQLGDDVSNRDGTEISATSIQFRALVLHAPTQIIGDVVWRHIIFWDQQANGAAPSAGDVLDQSVTTPATLAPYKRQYQKRFKIIYDKIFVTSPRMADPAAATTEVLSPVVYTKKKRSLARVVKYRNAQNTGAITDIASNSLYSLWVASNATAGNVSCGYRMYFKDD